MRARLARVATASALAAASLVLALLLGEALLRALPQPRRHYVYPADLRAEFEPSPAIMPGVEGISHFRVSSLGLRGDELSSAHGYRVLAVGGSTTQCLYLDQAEAWPQRLQVFLSERGRTGEAVWVGNAGKAGRRLPEHLLQLEYLLAELDGIDAVVMLLGANDLNRRLGEGDRYRPPDANRPEVRAELLARAFDVYPRDYALVPLWRTALFALVERSLGATRTRRHWDIIEDRSGRNYENWRGLRARAARLREDPPDLEKALEAFASDLSSVRALVRSHGVRVVFLTQPYVYRDDLPPELARLLWMGWVGERQTERGEYYSVSALERAYDAFNRTLLGSCRESGAECIDLEAFLPKDTRSFYDDIHFNEAGSERVARAVADHFLERPPFVVPADAPSGSGP